MLFCRIAKRSIIFGLRFYLQHPVNQHFVILRSTFIPDKYVFLGRASEGVRFFEENLYGIA